MSKIRNSLGVLVLPVPDDEITWDEYKKLYGIDLHELFEADTQNNIFRDKGYSKLIAVSLNYKANRHVGLGKVFFPNKIQDFTIGSPTTGFGKTIEIATLDSGGDQLGGEGLRLDYSLSDQTYHVGPHTF